jgi:hypothetical protein
MEATVGAKDQTEMCDPRHLVSNWGQIPIKCSKAAVLSCHRSDSNGDAVIENWGWIPINALLPCPLASGRAAHPSGK